MLELPEYPAAPGRLQLQDVEPLPQRPRRRRPRFLRLRKSLAVLAIAMGLSVSLVVTTPSNAQAFVGPGAVVAAPVLGAVAASTSPIWGPVAIAAGIGVLAVGAVFVIAAHNEGVFDFPWEAGNPYFDGLFDTPTHGPKGLPWLKFGPAQLVDDSTGWGMEVTLKGSAPTAGNFQIVADIAYVCRNGETGKQTQTNLPAQVVGRVVKSGTDQISTTYVLRCPTAGKPIGFTATPTKATPEEGSYNAQGVSYYRDKAYPIKDPQWETTVQCSKGDGVLYEVKKRLSALLGKVPQPSCGADGRPVKTKTELLDMGTNFGTGPLGAPTAPPLLDLTVGDTRYTECDPLFNRTPCKTEVHIDGFPCVVGSRACMDWAGLHKVNPARVECFFGTRKVDISLCFPLEGAYVPGGSTLSEANTDGNPATRDDPRITPGWVPKILGPDGLPVDDPNYDEDWAPDYPAPNPTPAPDVSTDVIPKTNAPEPSPGSSPSPSTSPSPGTDPGTSTPGFPNPEGGTDECGYKWSWNPSSWVSRQLHCAFVPKSDYKADAKAAAANFAARVPFAFPATIGAPGSSGCPDWRVKVLDDLDENFICDSSFTAAILNVRAPLFGLVSTAMVWPLLRSVWYASIPVLRVTPSSGK